MTSGSSDSTPALQTLLNRVFELRPAGEIVAMLNSYKTADEFDYGIVVQDLVDAPWAVPHSCNETYEALAAFHPSGYAITEGDDFSEKRWVYWKLADWFEMLTDSKGSPEATEAKIKEWLHEFEQNREKCEMTRCCEWHSR
jgi:hypothetical protein